MKKVIKITGMLLAGLMAIAVGVYAAVISGVEFKASGNVSFSADGGVSVGAIGTLSRRAGTENAIDVISAEAWKINNVADLFGQEPVTSKNFGAANFIASGDTFGYLIYGFTFDNKVATAADITIELETILTEISTHLTLEEVRINDVAATTTELEDQVLSVQLAGAIGETLVIEFELKLDIDAQKLETTHNFTNRPISFDVRLDHVE